MKPLPDGPVKADQRPQPQSLRPESRNEKPFLVGAFFFTRWGEHAAILAAKNSTVSKGSTIFLKFPIVFTKPTR